MNPQFDKLQEDLLKNEIGQIAFVVPNWKKAILPWMKLGKKFTVMRMNSKFITDYFVQGKPNDVDFVVDICFSLDKAEIEFITPLQGDTIYSQFLTKNPAGGPHHFVYQLKDESKLEQFISRAKEVGAIEQCRFTVNNSVTAIYLEFPDTNALVELWQFHQDGPKENLYQIPVTWDNQMMDIDHL